MERKGVPIREARSAVRIAMHPHRVRRAASALGLLGGTKEELIFQHAR